MNATQAVLLVLMAFGAFVLAVWVKDDAKSRGKPGCLVALMVLTVGCVPGLLIWLVFRPEQAGEGTAATGENPGDVD